MNDTVKIRSFRSGLTLAGQLQQKAVPRIGPWVLVGDDCALSEFSGLGPRARIVHHMGEPDHVATNIISTWFIQQHWDAPHLFALLRLRRVRPRRRIGFPPTSGKR
jgi:hypothetical protein